MVEVGVVERKVGDFFLIREYSGMLTNGAFIDFRPVLSMEICSTGTIWERSGF